MLKRRKAKSSSLKLKELEKENAALKRRIYKLESRLFKQGETFCGNDGISMLWQNKIKRKNLMSERRYLKYLLNFMQSTSAWVAFRKFMIFVRRFRIVSGLLKILTVVVALAETSAAVLVSVSALLVLLPVVAVLSLGMTFASLVRAKSTNRVLLSDLEGKRIYVLFGEREQFKKSSYFSGMACSFASNGGACIIVSPYAISDRGIGGRGHYVSARMEKEHVYILRKNYFFLFRRAVLERHFAANVVYIY